MSQDETPDVPIPDAAPEVAPENVALRAQPRPVTRLNRRTLALLTGGLGVAVLGATMWSLQPRHPRGNNDATELYNVDRVPKSEELDRLPADYSKLPPKVPELGPPLPGDVIGTVTEPVYDTATGRYLLIPQGSRIFGKYNSQVAYGQSRVQVVWNRIILPDTSSLTLYNLAGTDPAGYAGLEDGVDWHWDRIFAGAALTTLLGVGAELAAPDNRNGDRVIIAGRDSLQDSVNQAGQEMARRNLNIQPTSTATPLCTRRPTARRSMRRR